jgi:hypothetical protein
LFDEKRSGRPQTSEDVFSKQLSKANMHQFTAYVTNLTYQGQVFGEFCILILTKERIIFRFVTTSVTLFGARE